MQLYIAPVPETGFGEDDTATVSPIYLHVTKFGKKSQNIEKIEKQIARACAPNIFFFTGTCIRRAYILVI